MKLTERERQKFWSYVQKTDGCWVWTGGGSHGYGYFHLKVDGKYKRMRASRVSWMIHRGEIPPGIDVLHTCDNRPCIRPDHLFLGTDQDNADDREQKGRTARGDRSGAATHPERILRGSAVGAAQLNEEQVIAIRLKWKSERTKHRELALQYGVSRRTIGMIIRRQIWAHI